jgi:UDP-N-acetylglucosamine 1-carboxyvinyltransferase
MAAEYFSITGGHRLAGDIAPQGAKNEALQVLNAVLLTPEPVVLHNIPDILDVRKQLELLEALGCSVQRISPTSWRLEARNPDPHRLREPVCRTLAGGLRGSIMTVGPLLARFGVAYGTKPGGDKIGRRRLDTHFLGLQALGATFDFRPDDDFFSLSLPAGARLRGTYILLDEASVTGTANVLMAAVLAEGITTIFNAACEPYVQQLCHLLNRMGARIEGIGSNLLTVTGVEHLHGAEHTALADMIEVGSFIGLAAMTQSELTIRNCAVRQLGNIPTVFRRLGVEIHTLGDDLYIPAQELTVIDTFVDGSILTISDHTWPGFSPDLLSVALVVATQCRGTVLIHQKMFEARLFFVDKLIEMGAQIILCDPHRATVIGLARQHPLRGITMSSPDIRAGVALLLAALSARGTSRIHNIEQIDRGYQAIDTRLNALGAQIERRIVS